ncbi:MAG: hypothetical protein LBF37_01690 [Rickettsiales bacterium]|jgi:glutamyl-tRNA synthetase|nr:hypothetical protein [Rickettsiales bacterium]
MRNGLSSDLIARVLGGAPKYTIAQLEEKYPKRDLTDGAMVTRFAPSPTGFMHIGNLYGMMIDKKLAQQTGGVFYLRIEDTDTKREVSGAIDIILSTGRKFQLMPDEYTVIDGDDIGNYGPYRQSERRDIYHSVAAQLLTDGKAYPCFLTSDEMDKIREQQKAGGFPTGIYGEFARDRNITEAEITERMDKGEVPSIRLYSAGNPELRIFCKDAVRGSISFPQNNEDIVIIKSNDGLPTYHFAHLVDDRFMRTTHVVRGEEWLPSLPLHVQMFNMMEWTPPLYIHTSTLDKIDEQTGKQRKLSKSKDPEANVENFSIQGWPLEAVQEYLFNIMASGYEEAKLKGLVKNIWEWDLKVKKIPSSSALFNIQKLEWWAREFIATLSVDELARRVTNWAREYDSSWDSRLRGNDAYLKAILAIERGNPKRIRKDFITWSQTLEETSYFWDDLFSFAGENVGGKAGQDSGFEYNKNALDAFLRGFDANDDKDVWWNKIVNIATELGIKNGDVAMNLRVALTGRSNTPDLYSIMQVMGADRVAGRIGRI